MSHIFVTGAAGYLGSVLVGKLLNEGHSVIGYDNLMYGQQSLLQYIPNPNFRFVWGDVDNLDEGYENLIKSSNFILPLACIVGAPASSREYFKSNTVNQGNINRIADICYGTDIRVIYPTTNSGYGVQSGEIYCTEETELSPISPYGKQKVAAEKYLLEHHKNSISLRLATVFGVSPRMRLDLLVNFFVWKAVTEGVLAVAQPEMKRNYIHINDVCDCFIHCINNFEGMKGNAYNLGLNRNHSKGELAEIVQGFTGCEILETKSYVDPDKRNYIVSNDKINKAGFLPSVTVEGAIPDLIEACKMIKMLNYGREVNRNA